MRRRTFLGWTGALALGSLARPVRGFARREERYVERWSWAMGQPVRVQLLAATEDQGLEAAQRAIATLRRVEQGLSLFEDSSDLMELNRQAGRRSVRVADEVRRTLQRAQAIRRDTGGAFDIAVEPLMRAWGFRSPRRTPPTPAELAEARDAVRAARIVFDGNRVLLPASHTKLDAGGIGVGVGLDRAAASLREDGITSAIVNISGDALALGPPPGEPGWPVTVVDSAHPDRTVANVWLRNAGLATSSNEVSVTRFDGLVAGHILDPDTGRPAIRVRQATVLAPSGVLADALSTGLLVDPTGPAGTRAWILRGAEPTRERS